VITTVVFTKDRPAQLELLLESVERNGGGLFDVVLVDHPTGALFETRTRHLIEHGAEYVCFMCDDGILYRPLPHWWSVWLNEAELCLSLRLGLNTRICYPSGLRQELPPSPWPWRWVDEPQQPGVSDFGYPGSIDGHVFRRADLLRMLAGKRFPNPTAFECALVDGCRGLADERPLMIAFPVSVYVGNPVNRVSEQSGVRFGSTYPVSAEECRRRFDAGERIDLDALDFLHVDGAHTEVELVWK
jgi:hypothetical protein